jgi:acyl-CoA ligase (AMP-forming) (exosortase A-associated)
VSPTPFTVWDLLVRNLVDRADHGALRTDDLVWSYARLTSESGRFGTWLLGRGAERGDRVVIHLPKCFEEVAATFGCAFARTVFVNANWHLKPKQVQHIADDCAARFLITDAGRLRRLAEAGVADGFDHVVVVGDGDATAGVTPWSDLPAGDLVAAGRAGIGQDLAALLYTSGSTGRPKGVMVTHENLVQGAAIVAGYLRNSPEDRVLSLLPLSFDYGLSQVTTMMYVGGTVVLQTVPMAAEIVDNARRHHVTGIAAVPTIWTQVVRYLEEAGSHEADLKDRLPALRYVTNSGGKVPDPILRAWPRVMPGVDIVLMYGLTEAFRSTYLPPSLFASKMGSMGRAIPNVEVFVVRENGVCGPGEPGELVHRGALISRGYWGDPDRTDARIRVNEHLRPLIGDEKVLHSGDVVQLDEDGCLWFVGRTDHLIKCSGVRISPTEVEELVYESRLVDEVVAFGVPDELLGEAVHIAVSCWGPVLDVPALDRYCRRSLPGYMAPARIWPWDGTMPRTSSGKLDRTTVVRTLMVAAAVDPETGPAVEPTAEPEPVAFREDCNDA